MSVTVEYLFNSEVDLASLVNRVNEVVGWGLAPYEGNPSDQYCRFLGMEFTLRSDHGLDDDRDCNFEDYNFIGQLRTPAPDSDLRPIQIEAMALMAFALFRRLDITSGLLTLNVQTRLAHYRVVDDEWYDDVSGKAVQFPGHFGELRSRVSRE